MTLKRTALFVGTALVLSGVAALVAWSLPLGVSQSIVEKNGFSRLPGLYEPSGVSQLSDGSLLVIEDEPSHPFTVLTYQPKFKAFSLESLRSASLQDRLFNRFDDLEGITIDSSENLYAITSHSRKANGKRASEREKFIRFKVKNESQSVVEIRSDLRKRLTKKYPTLERAAKERDPNAGLNIEGIALNKTQKRLWIAFRSPLVKKQAVMVELLNPANAFDDDQKLVFGDDLTLLDLDNGGIRDITYDTRLDGYLVLSQEEGTKKEKPFKMWFWTGDRQNKPQRIRIAKVKKLHRAEGVAAVTINGEPKVLLLSDDGLRFKGQSARYALLDYDQLEIEPAR